MGNVHCTKHPGDIVSSMFPNAEQVCKPEPAGKKDGEDGEDEDETTMGMTAVVLTTIYTIIIVAMSLYLLILLINTTSMNEGLDAIAREDEGRQIGLVPTTIAGVEMGYYCHMNNPDASDCLLLK